MHDALYIGATGMQAQQLNVDTIANNLANVNTSGFKRSRVSFADLVAKDDYAAMQAELLSGQQSSTLLAAQLRSSKLGSGVGIATISKMFESGELRKTDSALDIAINGDGFLAVTLPDGATGYLRGGTLKINADGLLASQSGFPFKPGLIVPENIKSLIVSNTGKVQGMVGDQATPVDIGQLDPVRFMNPQALLAQGDNLYRATDASGEAIAGKAGEDGLGMLSQGYLENSNVRMIEEMISLMVAQRAYEASVKVVQASDEMQGMVNKLRN